MGSGGKVKHLFHVTVILECDWSIVKADWLIAVRYQKDASLHNMLSVNYGTIQLRKTFYNDSL